MKFQSFVYFIILAVSFEIRGLLGVRTQMQIVPSVVRRGEYTAIRCDYDLQGAPLYAVKWYRGMYEIYRFAPDDTPNKRAFPVPGIHVDISNSNETQVMLRKLEFNMTGNYSCEVSEDGPTFSTAVAMGHLEVIAPPESGPVIYVDQHQYNPGDTLNANCSAPPSRPALNLTILVNNQLMSGATKIISNVDGGFQRSTAMISLPLTEFHFRGGKLVLRCIAQLHPIYLDSAILKLPLFSDPKSERIMSSSAAGSLTSTGVPTLLIIFLFLYLINYVTCMDYDENFGFSDYEVGNYQEYSEIEDHIKASLLK